jgi:ketosteroid isomerase-like protein
MRQLLFASFLIIAFASLAHPQCKPSPTVRNAIEAANKAFVSSFNSGSAAAVAAMYTADAQLLPPNSPMIGNRQGIQSFWQNLITAGIKVVRLETSVVEACGDTAYEVGKYELKIPMAAGGTVSDHGKYVVIWKKQGRRWRLAHDIWNTNMPVGPTSPAVSDL